MLTIILDALMVEMSEQSRKLPDGSTEGDEDVSDDRRCSTLSS